MKRTLRETIELSTRASFCWKGIARAVREKESEMITDVPEVTLSPEDIPGADLCEPYEKHTVSALHWWILCRGIKVPTSWKKQRCIDR